MQNSNIQSSAVNNGGRIAWLDHVRTFIIFLVVLCHAGGVYESSGTWASFWIVDDPDTNDIAGLVFLILDIFMMPTLFLVSGYFTAPSLRSRSAGQFVLSKVKRLIVPWAIAVLTLIPLYKVIFLYSRGLPQENLLTYFHWTNGIWGMNWLWFLPVLFAFNLLQLALDRLPVRFPQISWSATLLLVFLAGFAYSLVFDIMGWRGWTKLPFVDFQNERLLIYWLAFLVGIKTFQTGAFRSRPTSGWLYHGVNATHWIPIMVYIVFLLYPWFKPGEYLISEWIHRSILWFSFHVSLFCLVFMVIETFRRYLNRTGSIARELSRNSYAVYIIHVVVQGIIATALLHMALPSFVKYALLTLITWLMCNLFVSCYRYTIGKYWRS